MSQTFETIIFMLFVTSVITSLAYIAKVWVVCRYGEGLNQQDFDTYITPHVRRYKIWNTIFGLAHLMCCTMFFTHAGRVCSGWLTGSLPAEEKENLDYSVYLFARGGYFVVASVFGLGNLIAFMFVGKDASQ